MPYTALWIAAAVLGFAYLSKVVFFDWKEDLWDKAESVLAALGFVFFIAIVLGVAVMFLAGQPWFDWGDRHVRGIVTFLVIALPLWLGTRLADWVHHRV
ncbi:hypothetical protein [Salininema proteolyticum]|uniref:Uncharacterized protein n=1 Tax=Salininema proteolyticum TaxID=1607685 RepID=A0ABV8U3K1_9ACTN